MKYKSLKDPMPGGNGSCTVADYLNAKIANDDGESKWPHHYDPDGEQPGPAPEGYSWKLGIHGYWTLGNEKLEVRPHDD